MKTASHTPTPWRVSPAKNMVLGPEGQQYLAWMEGPNKEINHANAAFIVRAVNSHDALVSALESAPSPPNDGDFECEDGGKEAEEKWWADYSIWLESVRSALSLANS